MRNCKLGDIVCAGKVMSYSGHNLEAVRTDPSDKRRMIVYRYNPTLGTECVYWNPDGERDTFDAWWVRRTAEGLYEFDAPFEFEHIDLNEDGWVIDENCFENIMKNISEQLQMITKIALY